MALADWQTLPFLTSGDGLLGDDDCPSPIRYRLPSAARDESPVLSRPAVPSVHNGRALNEDLSPDSGLQPCILLTCNFSCCDCNCCHSEANLWLHAKMSQYTSTYKSVMHSPVDTTIEGSVSDAAGLRAGTENARHRTELLPTKPHGNP